MSDTTVAILILPVLIALTLALECTRVGCTRLSRRLRENRRDERVSSASGREASARF